MGPRPLSAIALLLAAGCAGLPAGTEQPATIASLRANAGQCGQDGNPICEARVNHLEGKPVFFASSSLEVAPGRRTLGLFCRINMSMMIGDAQSFQREVDVTLAPGGRYRIEAAMEPAPCTLSLIDEATGKAVGKVR